MKAAAHLALMLAATTLAAFPALAGAVSGSAHKGPGSRYYDRLNRRPAPGLERRPAPGLAPRDQEARRQPYPHRYYGDPSRGNYGCHWMGSRAIETNNSNWWLRYRACTEGGG